MSLTISTKRVMCVYVTISSLTIGLNFPLILQSFVMILNLKFLDRSRNSSDLEVFYIWNKFPIEIVSWQV